MRRSSFPLRPIASLSPLLWIEFLSAEPLQELFSMSGTRRSSTRSTIYFHERPSDRARIRRGLCRNAWMDQRILLILLGSAQLSKRVVMTGMNRCADGKPKTSFAGSNTTLPRACWHRFKTMKAKPSDELARAYRRVGTSKLDRQGHWPAAVINRAMRAQEVYHRFGSEDLNGDCDVIPLSRKPERGSRS